MQKCVESGTLKKYLDGESTADPKCCVRFPEEIWFVDRKANETRDFVSFELASKFDLAGAKDSTQANRRQCLSVEVSQQPSAATPAQLL